MLLFANKNAEITESLLSVLSKSACRIFILHSNQTRFSFSAVSHCRDSGIGRCQVISSTQPLKEYKDAERPQKIISFVMITKASAAIKIHNYVSPR